jgi:hypothetical protein
MELSGIFESFAQFLHSDAFLHIARHLEQATAFSRRRELALLALVAALISGFAKSVQADTADGGFAAIRAFRQSSLPEHVLILPPASPSDLRDFECSAEPMTARLVRQRAPNGADCITMTSMLDAEFLPDADFTDPYDALGIEVSARQGDAGDGMPRSRANTAFRGITMLVGFAKCVSRTSLRLGVTRSPSAPGEPTPPSSRSQWCCRHA